MRYEAAAPYGFNSADTIPAVLRGPYEQSRRIKVSLRALGSDHGEAALRAHLSMVPSRLGFNETVRAKRLGGSQWPWMGSLTAP